MNSINRLPPVWLLVMCSAIGPIAMTITQPATSQLMRDFSAGYGVAQLVITVYLVATAVASLVLGPLSDRYGRRHVMMAGLSLFLLGNLLCLFSTSLEVLLLGRLVQGAGGAVGITLSRAIVRDVHSMEKSASIIGYINMAMVVAPMASPAVGGFLTELVSWRAIFLTMAVYTAILLFAVYRKQNETATPVDGAYPGPSIFRSALVLLKQRRFNGYVVALTFNAGLFFVFISGAPFIMFEIMGRSPTEYGAYFVLSALGYMTGNFITARYSMGLGTHRMMLLATVPMIAGVVLLWGLSGISHPLALFFPMFLVTLSSGLTIPNAIAAALSIRPNLAGSASGIAGFIQVGGGAAISFVTGFMQKDSSLPLMIMMTLCALLSFLGVYLALSSRETD